MAAAADRELGAGLTRERDDVRHVGGVCDADDDGRTPVNRTDEHGAQVVVTGVGGRDDPTADSRAKLRDGQALARVCTSGPYGDMVRTSQADCAGNPKLIDRPRCRQLKGVLRFDAVERTGAQA